MGGRGSHFVVGYVGEASASRDEGGPGPGCRGAHVVVVTLICFQAIPRGIVGVP